MILTYVNVLPILKNVILVLLSITLISRLTAYLTLDAFEMAFSKVIIKWV